MQNNSLPKSLHEENLLVDQLKSHLNYVCQQISQTEDRMSQLDKESLDFYYRLQRVQNSVCALKHKRYVQELIIDEDRPSQQLDSKFGNPDAELRDTIKEASEQGIQLISQMFKPIAIKIPNQILSENLIPNDIYEPVDPNLIRDLPPVIGSSAFNSWNVSDIVDRPTETSEITIGKTERVAAQQKSTTTIPKPQQVKEPSPALSIKSSSVIPDVAPVSDLKSEEIVEPKPKDEFLAQLNARLATDTLQKESKRVDAPVPQQRKPKVEEPPKQVPKSLLIDDSSSDESLFKAAPILKKAVKKTESQNEAIVKVPIQKQVEKPAQKSLLEDSDSFDELFKVPKGLTSTKILAKTVIQPKVSPAPTEKPKVEVKVETKVSPNSIEEPKTTPVHAVSKPVAVIRKPEPKKRSIFDSSSSEDEEPPPTKSVPIKAPILAESSDEEMPKSVLNSVSTDFSSRLNQALLKKPSPSPSSSITKPDEKPEPLPSTTAKKREPIEHKKQESVAALRGKIGDSIAKAHRHSAGLDHKTLDIKSRESSSDEAEVRKVEDQTLIQTLKARPRPSRAPRSRPPIPQAEDKEVKTEVKIEVKPEVKSEVKSEVTSKKVEIPQKEVTSKKSEPPAKEVQKPSVTSQKSSITKSTTPIKKPETTSQSVGKVAKTRKGLFDSSDSDDPF